MTEPAAEHRPPPRAVLLDMDGVLFHGEMPLPGASELLQALAGTPHLFLTNNPILPPEAVVAKFARLGLPGPDVEQVLTSAEATAAWLAGKRPAFRYYAVGADGLHQALASVGTADAEQADYVVVGEGAGLDYDSLTTGINLILKQGAQLVVTNPDHTVDAVRDGRHQVLPGGGALVAPFAVATGRAPVVIGKPEPLLYRMALERLGADAAASVMVGDRPDTDIAGAAALGMWTALVRTGRFAAGADWPAAQPKPDWDCPDLAALMTAWRRDCPALLGA
jgi:HAD superfamily hydrolase (TIGR01450 family)